MTDDKLTDNEKAFIKMVERNLVKLRAEKVSGEVTFRALLRDGGIMDSYKIVQAREK